MGLEQHLAAFLDAHPDGWSHAGWIALLESLEHAGLDVSDRNRIGMELEKARLQNMIERCGIRGMGPKRTAAIVDRFRTLWNLRHASVEDVAEIPTIHRALAERLLEAL